jgi:hypothetical protein
MLRFARNVILKAALLFLIANLSFAACYPMQTLGRISAYNSLLPGRLRLPYGDNPERAYNLSLYNLEAMFASHEIDSAPQNPGEYRVILIGDSATWGFLLPVEQTLAAYLNRSELELSSGRQLRVYNLGYPVMSLTKDLLILDYAMRYQPDLIVWPVTLESFPYDKQLYPPLLQNNPGPVQHLIRSYHLNLNADDQAFVQPTFWDRTIVGSRRPLADLLRLQLYGVMWAATGIDQDIPITYTLRMEDLPADVSFHNLQPPHLSENDLAFDVLAAGITVAGDVPVLIVNEPMFISQGENSHIRYNFYYPRWAYDDYRRMLAEKSSASGWYYLDLWDLVAPDQFTNSAVHMTPVGVEQFAANLVRAITAVATDTFAEQK